MKVTDGLTIKLPRGARALWPLIAVLTGIALVAGDTATSSAKVRHSRSRSFRQMQYYVGDPSPPETLQERNERSQPFQQLTAAYSLKIKATDVKVQTSTEVRTVFESIRPQAD